MRYVGARDFSSVVFGFCLVFNSEPRGKRPKMCRLSANAENSRRTQEKPLVPRVVMGQLSFKVG